MNAGLCATVYMLWFGVSSGMHIAPLCLPENTLDGLARANATPPTIPHSHDGTYTKLPYERMLMLMLDNSIEAVTM
jgi:hypothetical protein